MSKVPPVNGCVFCKISAKELPSKIVYEDKNVVAFWDIHPKAPVHILVVPKKHIPRHSEASEADTTLLGQMLLAAKTIAKEQNLSAKGYRLVINTGPDSGQIVDHLHLHILGGQPLGSMA